MIAKPMKISRQSISSWKRRTNQLQKSHNKYHAKKMTIDGIKFDSKAEAQYYRLYASNSQKSVSIHESFVILDGITVNGKKRRRRRYTPDFVYRDEKGEITKVVDVKPTKITADASLRIAMFVFRYKVPVTIARYDSRSGLFEEKEM